MSLITGVDDVPIVTAADVAADGEAPAAATVRVGFEVLLNGMCSLVARLITWKLSGAGPTAKGQKITLAYPAGNHADRWARADDGSGCLLGWYNHNVAGASRLTFEIIPPHAMARLATVQARIAGDGFGGGPHQDLPQVMPVLQAFHVEAGVATGGASVTDTSATKEIYDAPHDLVIPLVDNDPLSLGQRMLIALNGETGVNSLPDALMLYDITCTWANEPIV